MIGLDLSLSDVIRGKALSLSFFLSPLKSIILMWKLQYSKWLLFFLGKKIFNQKRKEEKKRHNDTAAASEIR